MSYAVASALPSSERPTEQRASPSYSLSVLSRGAGSTSSSDDDESAWAHSSGPARLPEQLLQVTSEQLGPEAFRNSSGAVQQPNAHPQAVRQSDF